MHQKIKKSLKHFLHRDFFFYSAVGGVSALVNFGCFSLFYGVFRLHYEVAVTLSYILSVLTHFNGNRRVTFKRHTHALLPQLKRYGVMLFINYLVTLLVMHIAVAFLSLSPYIGLISAIAVTVWIGFIMAKFWVFKHHKRTE